MKEVRLTQGQVALVDDADYERVIALRWYAHRSHGRGTWYAVRWEGQPKRVHVGMHRFILGVTNEKQVDHRDGNGLNNQRYNLRIATKAQNRYNRGPQRDNTSGYKGVTRNSSGRWVAQIKKHRRLYRGGTFDDPADAARAYDRLARELHGEFAWPNFPEERSEASHES